LATTPLPCKYDTVLSSACCSDHPWIKEDGEAPDTPLDNAVMNRLKQFRAMNQFKKAALRVRGSECRN
jgi:calcium-dependent protein kinase